MQPPQRIPFSRFPVDVLSILLLPATLILYVIASSQPRLWRTTLFGLAGVAFVACGIRLARTGRVLNLVWASIYLLMGFAVFYIAYIEATLFA
jgi:hypothetical protein